MAMSFDHPQMHNANQSNRSNRALSKRYISLRLAKHSHKSRETRANRPGTLQKPTLRVLRSLPESLFATATASSPGGSFDTSNVSLLTSFSSAFRHDSIRERASLRTVSRKFPQHFARLLIASSHNVRAFCLPLPLLFVSASRSSRLASATSTASAPNIQNVFVVPSCVSLALSSSVLVASSPLRSLLLPSFSFVSRLLLPLPPPLPLLSSSVVAASSTQPIVSERSRIPSSA